MKLLRYLPLIAMVCALSGVAKASTVGFHMIVVDPTFTVNEVMSGTTPVNFQSCQSGQLPSGIANSYVGCETFENETGSTLTNLQLTFPDTGALSGLTASECSADVGGVGYFQSGSCSLVNGNFVLSFSNGNVPTDFPGSIFTIAEGGIDPSLFPPGTLTTTPEPSSIWLLSTGAMMLGAFFYYKRRNGLGDQSL